MSEDNDNLRLARAFIALQGLGVDPTTQELADALWLAGQMALRTSAETAAEPALPEGDHSGEGSTTPASRTDTPQLDTGEHAAPRPLRSRPGDRRARPASSGQAASASL